MQFVWADGGRSTYFKSGNFHDDVIRAIANATGYPYLAVRRELNNMARRIEGKKFFSKKSERIYSEKIYRPLLEEWGWRYVDPKDNIHFREEELPEGTLIVRVNGRLTVVRNGRCYDTEGIHGCSDWIVHSYFKRRSKKDDEELLIDKREAAFLKERQESEEHKGFAKIKDSITN